MKIPKLIAICGRPHAGKTTVQNILAGLYGVQPVDDGMALRRFCVQNLDMEWDDVLTDEGKDGFVEILGKRWNRRKLLGEYGNTLEAMFGDHIMPFMATRNLDPDLSYSFASVRKNQGAFFKRLGGVVIGVENHGVQPSPHKFDSFDASLVDVWVDNSFADKGLDADQSMDRLADEIAKTLRAITLINHPIDFVEMMI